MTSRISALVLGSVLAISAMSACSSDTAATPATVAPNGSAATVASNEPAALALEISGSTFGAATAAAGETITVTNADSVDHSVTADNGVFSVDVPAGGSADLVVPAAGTYQIHCRIYRGMAGSIVIS